ncbi:MAG: hypothetical protein CM15mP79_2110 [Methanobacteriota archaeon]|nr:MAG: hypothetical protein CM15mP79_2110 [Euryarchaeota archaeon]
MTPTQMLLRMYRNTVGPTPHPLLRSVSLHRVKRHVECCTHLLDHGSDASTLTLTSRLTASLGFDLTSLAQSNIANGNLSMTGRLDVWENRRRPHDLREFRVHEQHLTTSSDSLWSMWTTSTASCRLRNPPRPPLQTVPCCTTRRLPTQIRASTDLDVGCIARCNRPHPDLARTQRRELIPFVGGQRFPLTNTSFRF